MPNSTRQCRPRSWRAETRLTGGEVLSICRKFVYPPCKKLAGFITLGDKLEADLGYSAGNRGMLALKTNQAFQMGGPDHFSSLDLCTLDTVQDHILAICSKLARAGRLIEADGAGKVSPSSLAGTTQ